MKFRKGSPRTGRECCNFKSVNEVGRCIYAENHLQNITPIFLSNKNPIMKKKAIHKTRYKQWLLLPKPDNLGKEHVDQRSKFCDIRKKHDE